MQHAEALFLVDHDQSEFFEEDIVLNQAMRADHDIHRAERQRLEDLFLLPDCAEAGEQFHPDRIIRHSLAEGIEMLLSQDGGGNEHGDLLAIHDGFESGADRHFGFAETDIAADQSIHRFG